MRKKMLVILSASLLLLVVSFFVFKNINSTQIHPHGYWIDSKVKHQFDESLAKAIVTFLKKEKAKSVADFGSGAYGYYVKYLLDHLIPCEGFDGNPFSTQLSDGIVRVMDLSQKIELPIKFEWVISLEVGNRIPLEFERVFIKNLDRHCTKGLILSWAVEHQKGKGHVNCRNNDYIKDVFIRLGYESDQEMENKLREAAHLGCFHHNLMVFRKSPLSLEGK